MKYNVSARGIIEKDEKILFIEYEDSRGLLYALPGGSQHAGEDLKKTLKREFKEETSLDIEAGNVVLVREFILHTSEFKSWKNGIHQVEIFFQCRTLDENQIAVAGEVFDEGMLGLKWIDKVSVKNYRVYPAKDFLSIIGNCEIPYLLSLD